MRCVGDSEVTVTDDGIDAGGSGADSGATSEAGSKKGWRKGRKERKEPGKQRSFWKELPFLVVIALVLALLIKTFFVQAFSIPSQSMQNALQVGDRVLVDKFTPWFGAEPERGEVVVFHDPGRWLPPEPADDTNPVLKGIQTALSFVGLMPSTDEQDLIKRVIGVGGDTVECSGTGPVKVNGYPLDEKSYIFPGNTPCGDKPFKVKVKKNHIWVMGDHREVSLDSRYHQDEKGGGAVPVGEVVGRAFAVAWPIGNWSGLGVPDTFSHVPAPK
jgi:signal peptidase I